MSVKKQNLQRRIKWKIQKRKIQQKNKNKNSMDGPEMMKEQNKESFIQKIKQQKLPNINDRKQIKTKLSEFQRHVGF